MVDVIDANSVECVSILLIGPNDKSVCKYRLMLDGKPLGIFERKELTR